MHRIKSIRILGFRNQKKPISIELNSSANFLIGRNGTGKTTLINLINASLDLELSTLIKSSFEKIQFTFKEQGNRRNAVFEISKNSPIEDQPLSFSFKESASANATDYAVFAAPARLHRKVDSRRLITQAESKRFSIQSDYARLRDRLNNLYRLTWLSLHRSEDDYLDDNEYHENQSPVDRRLSDVFQKLVSYFSKLDSLVSEETKEFQKEWFLSFLSSEVSQTEKVFGRIDFEKDKPILESIFKKFDLNENQFNSLLESRTRKLEGLYSNTTDKKYTLEDFSIILDTFRLHSLVRRWQELQRAQKATYLPRSEYVSICSDLLFRKSLTIDRGNKVKILSDFGSEIPLQLLSSGEKQLLIFLSETLLQERETHLFLADEPELSLHIDWQLDLVPNLLAINPNAQVLFATHSPDIVGKYQNNVIHMEDLIE